jgi:hypothetical protein
MNQQNLAGFIWSVAGLLRGDFKRSEFGRIILPFARRRPEDVGSAALTMSYLYL